MPIKATFLFGAGVEKDFGLPSGADFVDKTLPQYKKDYHESILHSLRCYFKNEYVQTKYANWLSGYRRDIVTKEEIQKRIAKHSNTHGILERLFHTIINPVKYGENRFWKVFNFYWFAYFAITEVLQLKLVKYKKAWLSSSQNENIYDGILHNLERFTRCIYKEPWGDTLDDHFYYTKKYYENNEVYTVKGMLTTNYTPLVTITGIPVCKIAFLNGKLNQFEYPYELIIKDFTKHSRESGDFYFPFIMAQSALKPIVHPEQIFAYQVAVNVLSESGVLIIIGYNINEDDNHINAIIIDFIRNNDKNKVLFCKYTDGLNVFDRDACHEELIQKLRLPADNKQLVVVKNEGDPAKLFNRINKILSDDQ